MLGRRPQSGVGGRHLVVDQRRQEAAPKRPKALDPGRGRSGCALVGDVLGSRAEHHVPEHGRRDQDPSCAAGGHWHHDL